MYGLFFGQNLSMNRIISQIINPYISIGEKDILWTLMELEEKDYELSTNELRISVPGQTSTVAEPVSTSGKCATDPTNATATPDQSRFALGIR